ncbi:MAG: peroxiredoxin-like family protein [Kiritimatiellia bacterium]
MLRYGWVLVMAGIMTMRFGVQAGEVKPLEAGAMLPDVSVRTVVGEAFSLKAAVAEKPAVLIFYRGGWCPYCTKHLMAMQAIEAKVLAQGYQILAISPDRPEKLAETLAQQKLGYTLLSDADMLAAKAFGLAFEVDEQTREAYKGYGIDLVEASGREHYMLPVPAVYVVNQAGKITYAFAEEDYKVRLEPAALLKVLAGPEKDKAPKAACCAACGG